ncbi:Serine/threonine-protein phosphatase 2A 56 kDa regulatory subunit delta isoform [Aduncisulcus paluster]|uniref:Serine/threonine-protein phosphatase 2A 56 kDa regulatory subunit delta isoform n=1 Tax=Aduncisulcus paluster TaxID=2918883 RepID=A0ABQ5K399_9EUKA|nr:Serine/threonine-protein phosphatase 2A 56 kDa regulatory subunit delta isoform [Aduncisulcus paluster]
MGTTRRHKSSKDKTGSRSSKKEHAEKDESKDRSSERKTPVFIKKRIPIPSSFKPSLTRKLLHLKEAKEEAVVSLFIMKLRQASIPISPLDMSSPQARMKKNILRELLEYMRSRPDVACCEPVIPELVVCVSLNLFTNRFHPPNVTRIISIQMQHTSLDVDFDEPRLDPAWEIIELVHMLFLQMLISREFKVKIARNYINLRFITQFINRFQSDDPRERDFLKGSLHRIYVKFVIYRAHIRRSFGYILSMLAGGNSRNEWRGTNGVAEILEILGSIINGFSQPLRLEHRHFLMHHLLPLHELPRIRSFHPQLAQCTVQYVGREADLVVPIINRLVRIFPHCNAPKASLLLNELEELIERCETVHYQHIAKPLVNLLSRCCCSAHFQIAERTLVFLQNRAFKEIIKTNQNLVSVLVKSLCSNLSSHWNQGIIELSYSSMGTLLDINRDIVEMSIFHFSEEEQVLSLRRRARFYSWEKIGVGLSGAVDSIPSARIVTSRGELKKKLKEKLSTTIFSPFDTSVIGQDPLGDSPTDIDMRVAHEIVAGKRKFFSGDEDESATPSIPTSLTKGVMSGAGLTPGSGDSPLASVEGSKTIGTKQFVIPDAPAHDVAIRSRRRSLLPTTVEAREATQALEEWVPVEQRFKDKK